MRVSLNFLGRNDHVKLSGRWMLRNGYKTSVLLSQGSSELEDNLVGLDWGDATGPQPWEHLEPPKL